MSVYEYAPERVVRLVNDPIYRFMMLLLNRSTDGGVCHYCGDRQVEIWDFEDEWDEYETGQAAAMISVLPTVAYIGLIGVVGMNAPGTLPGLAAMLGACAIALVSVNDCCEINVEYHAVDEGEVIGRARSGEVFGS